MDIIQKTQFANFNGDFKNLPKFLQQKLNQAQSKPKPDQTQIHLKLERAHNKRTEKLENKQMKLTIQKILCEEAILRGKAAKETKKELFQQIYDHKNKMADELVAEALYQKINNCTKNQHKSNLAKSFRSLRIDGEEQQKLNKLQQWHDK